MKVLLAYRSEGGDLFTAAVPVGLGTLAAVLRQDGVDAVVANYSGESWRAVQEHLAATRADIVALSVFTHNRVASSKLARLAKELRSDCLVVCGGPHASFAITELLAWPGVDAVVVGEGEETLREVAALRRARPGAVLPSGIAGLAVAAATEGGANVQPVVPRAPITNLDDIPFPIDGLRGGHNIDLRQQAEFIITSRGCPSSCVFCSSPGFWGRGIRFRSAESVIRELGRLQRELGLLHFSIRDDTFTANRQRAIEICRRIIDARLHILWTCQSRVSTVDEELLAWMKRAGCESIQFGVESGSPRILQRLGKHIRPDQVRSAIAAARRVGLLVSVYLIVGVPGEAEADIVATEKLLAEVRPHDGQVSPLAYFPGTALFREAVASGAVRPSLFVDYAAPALFVRSDPEVAQMAQRLIAALKRGQQRAAYTPADYTRQKQLLGYCHATNLQAGEWHALRGRWKAAQQEYEEITRTEPGNPWGWLSLGELAAERGDWRTAAAAFEQVHALVPNHLPVLYALAEVAAQASHRQVANKWKRQAALLATEGCEGRD